LAVNGELSQLICLATYGTNWLRRVDSSAEPPDFAANTTFKYVNSAEFTGVGGRIDTSPAAWLRDIRARSFDRLWLVLPDVAPVRSRWPYLQPHLEVAFANGGHWFALATGKGPTEAWRASWSVIEPRPADDRIWAIRYEGTAAPKLRPQQPAIADARSALDAALAGARAFAQQANLPEWSARFTEAMETDDDRPPYQPDLMDPSFPDEARRLVAKASRSWVFGGMGSWNDVGFKNDEQRAAHANVSSRLFDALMTACVAAVNCPRPDSSPKMGRPWP
jgi:hypothetical protein